MDSKMEQILELIIISLKKTSTSKKIGDIIFEQKDLHNYPCTNEYDNYTIEQFLVLFRISYLKYLNIIDEETSKLLEGLYLLRMDLNRRMGDIAYKNLYDKNERDQEKIDSLYNGVQKIDEVLNKFHLLAPCEDSELLFFTTIENGNYENIASNEEIKELMKELKR